jgi:long-chain acyl-CoA synthetase
MPSGASRSGRAVIAPGDALVRAFDRRAARRRDQPLVVAPAWQVTVGDIDDGSRRVEALAREAALAPGAVVGLAAPNGAAFLSAFLGLRRARCVVLLLDYAAPWPDGERALAAIGAAACLVSRAAPDGQPGIVDLVRSKDSGRTSARTARPGRAVIKLTSGSTGDPRGVALGTDALLADEDALARTMGLTDRDRLVAAVPMSHSYGLTTLALAALVRGLTLVQAADDGPLAPIEAADRCGATVFPTVPAYLQAVLRLSAPRHWPDSLRLCITAGAPLSPVTAARFREATGRRAHVFYGASECGGICFDRSGEAGERGSVGTPVEGVRLSLAAPAPGDPGGILEVRSAAVGETYVPAPDSRLLGGCFRTSDLASRRGDEIVLHRRADGAIVVRGFKVDPVEVERVIAAMPGVEDVVVTAATAPQVSDSLVRAVVVGAAAAVDAAAVTAWCRARLADHKVPRSIVIVAALPRTSRGKVDRAALLALPVRPRGSSAGHA